MHYYYLVLSLHLISIVIWIGTLFTIYQLIFIQNTKNKFLLQKEAFSLFKKLASPSFAATIFFGVLLVALNKAILESGFWIYLKFLLISFIIMLHHMSKNYLLDLQNNCFKKTKKIVLYHSFMPFLLFAFVALLTILKPF